MRGPGSGELYLEAIEQLKTTVKFFNSNKNFKSSDGVVYHANQLLAKSISKLEEEFKTLLSNYRLLSLPIFTFEGGGGKHSSEQQKSLETAIYTLPTLIPLRVVLVLHDLALQMVQVGRQLQLLRIFRDTRATVLEQSLRKLGVERLTKVDVQRLHWEVLEAKIATFQCFYQVKFLFSTEKKICDQILEGIESLRDPCFAEVTVNSMPMLLSFGDVLAKSKRSPEKLFFLLDMYEKMRESCYEFEIVFGSKAYMEMKESIFNLAIQLAQTAQETFIDFEEALERDATKSVVLD
ncbi:Exocyst complex component EXO70A1 [Linum perenne]